MSALAAQRTAQFLATGGGGHLTLAGGAAAALILAIVASLLLLAIAALVSVLGSPLGGGMKLVWVVIVLAAPVIGSLAWFVIGRRDAERRGAFG